MRFESLAARSISVVDRTLRSLFPEDYYKRCMYAAFGVHRLLYDAGIESRIIGGDFCAFVVGREGLPKGLHGFGNGEQGPSHYWVETETVLLDLGLHYLPLGSSYPAAKMPIAAWHKSGRLPPYLRYHASIQYAPSVELAADKAITDRMRKFLKQCISRNKTRLGQPKLPCWLLTGEDALLRAARGGDFWARKALDFSQQAQFDQLPF